MIKNNSKKAIAMIAMTLGICACTSENADMNTPIAEEQPGGLVIGVSLPNGTENVNNAKAETRVVITDNTDQGGKFTTEWEADDKLTVWHWYNRNSYSSKTFVRQNASNQPSAFAKFQATDNDGAFRDKSQTYSQIYSFNNLPAGNYTINYTSPNFTITLANLNKHAGTLQALKNYDAMWSVAWLERGKPLTITMKHLLTAFRFDLESEAFGGNKLTNIVIRHIKSTAQEDDIFVKNATLKQSWDNLQNNIQTGNLNGIITKEASDWTNSEAIDIANNKATIYLMTPPFGTAAGVNGKMMINAIDAEHQMFQRVFKMENYKASAGDKKHIVAKMRKQATLPGLYYAWDAKAPYESMYKANSANGINDTNYNPSTGAATNSCRYCPTLEEAQRYLGAGIYWDTEKEWVHPADGKTYKGGMWLKKKQYIDFETTPKISEIIYFADQDNRNVNMEYIHGLGAPPASKIDQYFFLPFAGWITGGGAPNRPTHLAGMGGLGKYWLSSTNPQNNTQGYELQFHKHHFGVRQGEIVISVNAASQKNQGLSVWDPR